MRVCLFEDRFVSQFEPLTLTRPVFSLYGGLATLGDKLRRHFNATELGALVRPHLAATCRADSPFVLTNELDWLHGATTILANGRWLPPLEPANLSLTPHVGLVGSQIAYAVLPPHLLTYCSPNTLDDCLECWKQTLPGVQAGGLMANYPWQLLHHVAAEMEKDLAWRTEPVERGFHPSALTLVGPSEELYVHETAELEPWVVADTSRGPVVVDREARVEAFSRLEGPCYIGPRSVVMGAKLRHAVLGPGCRVGGEVEHSILQGFVTKENEGFLGHSYLGAWTHLSPGVEVANRRLDYQPLQIPQRGGFVESGCRRLGICVGDHTQVGIGGLLNAGSLIGAFCDVLPHRELCPRQVPSFCQVKQGQIQPQDDLMGRFQSAAELMALRGWSLNAPLEMLYRKVHDLTAPERRQLTRSWVEQYLRAA